VRRRRGAGALPPPSNDRLEHANRALSSLTSSSAQVGQRDRSKGRLGRASRLAYRCLKSCGWKCGMPAALQVRAMTFWRLGREALEHTPLGPTIVRWTGPRNLFHERSRYFHPASAKASALRTLLRSFDERGLGEMNAVSQLCDCGRRKPCVDHPPEAQADDGREEKGVLATSSSCRAAAGRTHLPTLRSNNAHGHAPRPSRGAEKQRRSHRARQLAYPL